MSFANSFNGISCSLKGNPALRDNIGTLVQVLQSIPVAPNTRDSRAIRRDPSAALYRVPRYTAAQIYGYLQQIFPASTMTETELEQALFCGTRRGMFLIDSGLHVVGKERDRFITEGDVIATYAFNTNWTRDYPQ